MEAELSKNNVLLKTLRNDLQNMTGTLERKELKTSELYASVTGFQKKLYQVMENGNEYLVNWRITYKAILQ
jgi:hypothetical protein